MADRSLQEIRNQPCKFKLKDIVRPPSPTTATPIPQPVTTESGTRKVKRIIQKTDENGNPLFKMIKVEKKKGCGCKGKAQQTVIEEKRVPDTIEIWVEEPVAETVADQPKPQTSPPPVSAGDTHTVLCKLYGTVPESYCQKCKSYKK